MKLNNFFFIGILSTQLLALDSFYEQSKKGWFFYETIKKDEVKKEELKEEDKKDKVFTDINQIPINALNTLTATEFRQAFEFAKDIAVMNPTSDNVYVVQVMNTFMSENANKFSSLWQRNLLDRNKLISDKPMTTFENDIQKNIKKKEEKEFFANTDLNYFVFYKDIDDKLLNIKRLITSLEYKVPTKFININEYPNITKEYNIDLLPSIYAVTKNKKKRISNGNVLTQDLIIYYTLIQLKDNK
ncbi:conjugal transfer protein TraF [Campylobacter sp. MG1]|uniref:conjugal transfer protein TraF n=1 Tax=Campylobacter sp. MG1 TaxID=2976332 RepID=UPI00226CAC39|nr:conjugal transfer protein TraF [Campylobacter sp. MG1]